MLIYGANNPHKLHNKLLFTKLHKNTDGLSVNVFSWMFDSYNLHNAAMATLVRHLLNQWAAVILTLKSMFLLLTFLTWRHTFKSTSVDICWALVDIFLALRECFLCTALVFLLVQWMTNLEKTQLLSSWTLYYRDNSLMSDSLRCF